MKLFVCDKSVGDGSNCGDIVQLIPGRGVQTCTCGNSHGQFVEDSKVATYGGDAVPIVIDNKSFFGAINRQPRRGRGVNFSAFIVPSENDGFCHEDDFEGVEEIQEEALVHEGD